VAFLQTVALDVGDLSRRGDARKRVAVAGAACPMRRLKPSVCLASGPAWGRRIEHARGRATGAGLEDAADLCERSRLVRHVQSTSVETTSSNDASSNGSVSAGARTTRAKVASGDLALESARHRLFRLRENSSSTASRSRADLRPFAPTSSTAPVGVLEQLPSPISEPAFSVPAINGS